MMIRDGVKIIDIHNNQLLPDTTMAFN